YQVVLLDLDGTLSDSALGILQSLRLAFDEVGVPWVDQATARALLGPPFWHSLPPLVGADNVDRVVASYRRHYWGGAMLRTTCYPGVAELLAELAGRELRLAVATSKAEPQAVRIIEHLGLTAYFETVCGDTLDGRRDSKALVVGEALRRLGRPDPSQVLMVGDRSHDVLGAAAHGIGCAGALWGYGSVAELAAAGALRLCEQPVDLLELVEAGSARPDRAG
ncbi:MAG TPA: HAD hydrolase-like protein, partial [Jatrophihabitans sp.]|nr:HAD hydrolase-like protein [Jatrophihabitans sp.]